MLRASAPQGEALEKGEGDGGTMGYEQNHGREELETAVRSWRFEQFVRLGFTNELSAALAASRCDLSQVRKLIQSGCPPETASRIVL